MSKIFSFLTLLTVMALSLPLCAVESGKTSPVKVPFEADGRKWELVREEDADGQGLVEYLPAGQTPEKWQEVVTVQYFSSDKINAQQLYQLFMKDIESQASDGQLSKQVYVETPANVLAEWNLKGTPHDQTELVRIFNNGKLMAIVRYTNRAETPSKELMTKWKSILEKVQI